MTQPVNDDDYAEDQQTVVSEDLPDEADPSTIPADQGDKGAA